MIQVINPANGKVLRELEEDTAATIQQKFNRAKAFQPTWKRVPLAEKLTMIRKFRDMVIERKESLATVLTSEVGKPISQSRNELTGLIGRIDFFLDNTARAVADEVVFQSEGQGGMVEKISHEPLGVIANISAWNYPYFVGSNVFIPALLTGNCVLYKPSEFSALTGLAIENMLHSCGVPQDAFIAVMGGGLVGAELMNQPIQGVFFTGSFATGQKIAAAAQSKMIKVQLELGGKDPAYICDDVAVADVAAAVADGAFYNAGQSCCSVERIYVHHRIYDAFVESFMNSVSTFVTGDPMNEKTYVGPLTREAHLRFLEKQVEDAIKKGAKLLTGGKRIAGPGNFFEPTVFINVNHSMDLMREESFGPIIGIQKVMSDEEALSLMNDTAYGLTAAVYTKDQARASKILSEVNAGTTYWNCCDRVSPRLPWSGRGHSGIGSTLSMLGIEAFTQPKAWHLRG